MESGAWAEGAVVRGKYKILAKLGEGGMGAVYKAMHLRFGEVRALKVMSAKVAGDPLFVKRFEHEGVITRKLQHANAVRVDDIDETEDGRPFIVMEFIEGRSLKQVIRSEGPLAAPRVCAIVKQVAAALGAAHAIGMVHRDIKPDNIVLVNVPRASRPWPDGSEATAPTPASMGGTPMLRPHELAKVLDFGIAKLKEARAAETSGESLTGTGVVIGTPEYMSPEQAAGKSGDALDGRSDLYSLGVVMYEMLSGNLPFKTDTPMGMLVAHMHEIPRPVQSARPDLQIPNAIAAVVMQCLEKKPEQRPPNAEALIGELEGAEKQSAIPVAPTVVPVRTPSPPRSGGFTPPPRGRAMAGKQDGGIKPPLPSRRRQIYWAMSLIGIASLSVTGWYIETHRAGGVPPPQKIEAPADQPGAKENKPPAGPSGSQASPTTTEAKRPGQAPALQPTTAKQPATKRASSGTKNVPAPITRPTTTTTNTPPAVTPKVDVAAIQKQVTAATTEGDLDFQSGAYDDAIQAYQNGLNADPSNAALKAKLQKARHAKSAEQSLGKP